MNDTHVQLLVIDECTQSDLFSKNKLAETKRLLERHGMSINNKQKALFEGFHNCFTFMTMNNLPYPFTQDLGDATDEDKIKKKYD